MQKFISTTFTCFFLSCLCLTFFPISCVFASNNIIMTKVDDTNWNRLTYEKKVYQILSRLTAANNIKKQFGIKILRYSKNADTSINLYTNILTINGGLFKYIDNDDELAAIIAHEVAISEHRHLGTRITTNILTLPIAIMKPTVFISKAIRNKVKQPFETEADYAGIDYMVKAGYNPIAMETIISKLNGDGIMSFHKYPNANIRIKNINNYITLNYPTFLLDQTELQSKSLNNENNMDEDITEQEHPSLNSANNTEINHYFLSNNNKNIKDFDYSKNTSILPYLKNIQQKVVSKWYHPKLNKTLNCTITITINNLGSLTSLKILKSSGNDVYDMSCINAVKISSPFGKFPIQYSSKNIVVEYSFNYFTTNDPMVFMNIKTHKIHTANCRLLKKSRDYCIQMHMSEALKKGGQICKVCH